VRERRARRRRNIWALPLVPSSQKEEGKGESRGHQWYHQLDVSLLCPSRDNQEEIRDEGRYWRAGGREEEERGGGEGKERRVEGSLTFPRQNCRQLPYNVPLFSPSRMFVFPQCSLPSFLQNYKGTNKIFIHLSPNHHFIGENDSKIKLGTLKVLIASK
jgi:hypothetical protein